MSLISTASYDQLEVMVKSAVTAGFYDHGTGHPHVPLPLLEKLQGLSKKYSWALQTYRDDRALGKELRKRRDEISTRLSRHVRNIHFMFQRLFGMGDVRLVDMTLFGIPETAMREAAHRIDIWRHQAHLIIRGFKERETQSHEPLPPYLMGPAIVALIQEQKVRADEVAGQLHKLKSGAQKRHQALQTLRAQLVHQMEWLQKHLEVSLFEYERPARAVVMKGYGIPVPQRRGATKSKEAPPEPKALAPPEAETAPETLRNVEEPVAVAKREPASPPPEPAPKPPIGAARKPVSPPPQPDPQPPAVRKQQSDIPPAAIAKREPASLPPLPEPQTSVVVKGQSDPPSEPGPHAPAAEKREPDGALKGQNTPPNQTTTSKPARKKKPVTTKGQRRPPTKKEKEKKKTSRKIARKSRRGK